MIEVNANGMRLHAAMVRTTLAAIREEYQEPGLVEAPTDQMREWENQGLLINVELLKQLEIPPQTRVPLTMAGIPLRESVVLDADTIVIRNKRGEIIGRITGLFVPEGSRA
jgi:hypothetical protein